MSQELRKSLVFATICCNLSLLQLQIIPPSTAESDKLHKQPIATHLGLEPETLKHFSPSSPFLYNWKDLTNTTQYFQDLSGCLYQCIAKRSKGSVLENCPIYKCSSYFKWVDRQCEERFLNIHQSVCSWHQQQDSSYICLVFFKIQKYITEWVSGNSLLFSLTKHEPKIKSIHTKNLHL